MALISLFTIFLLPFVVTASLVQIGSQQFDQFEWWGVNCYNDVLGTRTSEMWQYSNPGGQPLTEPDSKLYLASGDTVAWEGAPLSFSGTSMHEWTQITVGYNISLIATAHDQTEDGTLVGAMGADSWASTIPCYSYRNDKVDFFNGWVCYRLYRCNSIPHYVTDIQFSSSMVNVQHSFYADKIREASIQGVDAAPVFLEADDGNGNKIELIVSAHGDSNQGGLIKGFSDNGDALGNGFTDMFWTNLIADGYDNVPSAFRVTWYAGPTHTTPTTYELTQTGLTIVPPASCHQPSGLQIAGIVTSIVASVAAAVVAPPLGAAAAAVTATGLGATALNTMAAFKC